MTQNLCLLSEAILIFPSMPPLHLGLNNVHRLIFVKRKVGAIVLHKQGSTFCLVLCRTKNHLSSWSPKCQIKLSVVKWLFSLVEEGVVFWIIYFSIWKAPAWRTVGANATGKIHRWAHYMKIHTIDLWCVAWPYRSKVKHRCMLSPPPSLILFYMIYQLYFFFFKKVLYILRHILKCLILFHITIFMMQLDKQREWEMMYRVKPDVTKGREMERSLQRIATR